MDGLGIDDKYPDSLAEDKVLHDEEKQIAAPTIEEDCHEEEDSNVVDWESPKDAQNPLNWTPRKKWTHVAVVSGLTFLTPLGSSIFAPGVPALMKEFNSDSAFLATFVVSIYLLGWVFGPLVVAPLSELYGRLRVYHICSIGFIAFTVACALSNSLNMLIGFRFLEGVWAAAPITIGGGSVADLFRQEERGLAMSLWAMGPLIGPVVGPVAGGFLAHAEGWRWVFWLLAILSGTMSLIALPTMRETYAPVLLARKAERLRRETGNDNLRSRLDRGESPQALFRRTIVRPCKLMTRSPICSLMALYMAVSYGFIYLMFTTFTFVFEETYGFSPSIVGLSYVPVGVGMLAALAIIGASSDRIIKRLALKTPGNLKPEYRLPLLVYSGFLMPTGLLIYGWSAQYKIHWAVPLFGTAIFGLGNMLCYMPITMYLVDAFTLYAASAVAVGTVMRSVLGGVFPLFGLQMYNELGLGWGNSLLAFVSLALWPIGWVLYAYGERVRTSPRFQVKL